MSGRHNTANIVGGNGQRARYGCIVSFLNEHGEDLTLHRTGSPRAGLIDACRVALAFDPSFRVTAYSTPQTIYDDMTGARMDFDSVDGHRTDPVRPEAAALAGARLGHLAHPLLGVGRSVNDSRNHRRARTGVGRPPRS